MALWFLGVIWLITLQKCHVITEVTIQAIKYTDLCSFHTYSLGQLIYNFEIEINKYVFLKKILDF